jgi:hypothetical protein
MEERWDLDEAKNIKATPWDLLQRTEVETILKPVADRLEEFEDKESKGPRRFKITKRDLGNPPHGVGSTRGCQQCEHILKEGRGRGGLQHSERCRERVMRELAKTPADKARIDKAEERITKALVEMSGDVDGTRPSQTGAPAVAPPGSSGTGSRRGIDTENAVPYAGVRLTERVRVPELRPGNMVSEELVAARQGDDERREGSPHPRDPQVYADEAEPASEMDMGFMDKDEITIFLIDQL